MIPTVLVCSPTGAKEHCSSAVPMGSCLPAWLRVGWVGEAGSGAGIGETEGIESDLQRTGEVSSLTLCFRLLFFGSLHLRLFFFLASSLE